jgi:2-polyprenyl-3-methyl-5-hydroxy-6-metoxy-1,4-benzoquinol methylase
MSSAPQPGPDDFDPPLTACPLCGGELRRWDRDHRGRTLDRCQGCGVGLMNPQYSDDWLRRFYSTYISGHGEPSRGAPQPERYRSRYDVRKTGKQRCLRMVAEHVRPGRILMIGCGDGVELGFAKELGWQVEGYDVDPETTAEISAQYGVPVHCGPFEDLELEAGSYACVWADQVLEHPKNPQMYLRRVRELLQPGGVLFLGTPNVGSYSNRYKTWLGQVGLKRKRRGHHYNTRHHIFFYTPPVMRHLLEEHYGFRVLTQRTSQKPARNPLGGLIRRGPTWLDSSFLTLAVRDDAPAG